jgi:hypothetical protein
MNRKVSCEKKLNIPYLNGAWYRRKGSEKGKSLISLFFVLSLSIDERKKKLSISSSWGLQYRRALKEKTSIDMAIMFI